MMSYLVTSLNMPRRRSYMFFVIFLILLTQIVTCSEYNTDMTNIEGKIVGGKPVPLENFPHMVQLFNSGSLCAGTILTSWAVMTAGHCFDYNQDIDQMEIHAGARYTYDMNADIYDVWYYIKHEDYNKVMPFSCDIALVFVRKPIGFSEKSKKAVIANTNAWMIQGTTNFSATGWGLVHYNGPFPSHGLMTTRLHLVPLDKCGKLHNLTMSKDMFCLYGNGKHDTCKGDSGGGIEWHGMIVGIVSHGDGCAQINKPSVYSNVWYFRTWIEKQIWDFRSKFCNMSIIDGIRKQCRSGLRIGTESVEVTET